MSTSEEKIGEEEIEEVINDMGEQLQMYTFTDEQELVEVANKIIKDCDEYFSFCLNKNAHCGELLGLLYVDKLITLRNKIISYKDINHECTQCVRYLSITGNLIMKAKRSLHFRHGTDTLKHGPSEYKPTGGKRIKRLRRTKKRKNRSYRK